MGRLEGKIAVITGSNSGIGLASAKRFVAEGAYVYITGRRQEELDKAVQAIGAGVMALQGDVSNLADLDRLFSKVRSDQGRTIRQRWLGRTGALGQHHGTVLRLGFWRECQRYGIHRAKGASADAGRRVHHPHGIHDGLDGNACLQRLQREQGRIRNLARSWALDLKGTGIRVNVLSPGATATPGLLNGLAKTGKKDAMIAGLIDQTPLGRMAGPDDIAAVALFFASDESASMTGSEIFADGGMAQV